MKKRNFFISIVLTAIMLAGCNNPMESRATEDGLVEQGKMSENSEEDIEDKINTSANESEDEKLIESNNNLNIIWQAPFNAYEYSSENFIVKIQEKPVSENKVGDEDAIYEIVLTDSSERVLQQFSDSTVVKAIQSKEQIVLTDINSDWYNDLLIGDFLYMWNPSDNIFYEKVIQMPEGYKVNKNKGAFTVYLEEGSKVEESIYKINRERCEIVKLRTWILDKDAKSLEIRDCLKDKIIFLTQVEFDEEGKLKGEEYYQILFWHDLPSIRSYVPESLIKTVFWGMSSSEQMEFENREALLDAYGFENAEPFYQYYDISGNIDLELYLDENTGAGCGIRYFHWYTEALEEVVEMQGFAFDNCQEVEWIPKDPYTLVSVDGTDGADAVADYEEIFEYTDEGEIDYYKSLGYIDWLVEGEESSFILEFNYAYRDDGTLAYRNYYHNSYIFSTTSSGISSFYDEEERLIYEDSYITHGWLDHYYIYKDDGNKPMYYLELDNNLGTVWPQMIKYK